MGNRFMFANFHNLFCSNENPFLPSTFSQYVRRLLHLFEDIFLFEEKEKY